MYPSNDMFHLSPTLRERPHAAAVMRGSGAYPHIGGSIKLYQTRFGVLVVAELTGLPTTAAPCTEPIFALHIHEGESCTGNASDPFADARTHYNPSGCPHPYHAGDLPPVFGANGMGFLAVLTDRFAVTEVIGKTVILHAHRDDFSTQPAGAAGEKIACGVILE